MRLFHGTNQIIIQPSIDSGNPHNDYGYGFYTTQHENLAKEWACKSNRYGIVNEYDISLENLHVLKLEDPFTMLNWLAILMKHRVFTSRVPIAMLAKDYLLQHFLPDLSQVDVIIGFRADDSYYSFAEDFITNQISLETLSEAMHLGELGLQVCLKSKKSLQTLEFQDANPVDRQKYFPKFVSRDETARLEYQNIRRNQTLSGLYIRDILREEIKNDDVRIPKIRF